VATIAASVTSPTTHYKDAIMRILAISLVLLFSGCSIARVTVRIQNGAPTVDFRFNQPKQDRSMNEYEFRIVYREPGNSDDNWNFDCHAKNSADAIEKLREFMPNAIVVAVHVSLEVAE
jgi:hypothetical protein